MSNKKKKDTHSSTCIYKKCGIKSRDNLLNVRFYRLPIDNKDRLITWLVNSGCDNLVEESDAELRKLRICSKHFEPNAIYPGGRLKKDAEPLIYPPESDDEDSVTSTDMRYKEQLYILKTKLARKNKIIKTLKERNVVLKRNNKAKDSRIVRLQKNIRTGNLSNKSLFNALSRRVRGFLLTFLTMQLFHKKQSIYTQEEKELTKKMHYTSPRLYIGKCARNLTLYCLQKVLLKHGLMK